MFKSIFLSFFSVVGIILRAMGMRFSHRDDKWITNEGKMWPILLRSWKTLSQTFDWQFSMYKNSWMWVVFFFFNRSCHLLFIFCLSCSVCHISFIHGYSSEMCILPTYAQEFQPLTTMFSLKENWENSRTEHDNRCERFRERWIVGSVLSENKSTDRCTMIAIVENELHTIYWVLWALVYVCVYRAYHNRLSTLFSIMCAVVYV